VLLSFKTVTFERSTYECSWTKLLTFGFATVYNVLHTLISVNQGNL